MIRNARLVAGREYSVRVRSRAFAISTVFLAIMATAAALTPIGIRVLERDSVTRIAASAPDARSGELTLRSLEMVFNAATNLEPGAAPEYEFSLVDSAGIANARDEVTAGSLDGLLLLTHGPAGRLDFEYVTASPAGRQAALFQLVAITVAASIRADEAKGLVGDFVVTDAVPGDAPGGSELDAASRQILATILIMLVLVTSVTYGMWVATSVVEEKASRVMEVMLNAATPGEMLAGKVVGVGGAGITQLAAIVLPAAVVVALQEPLMRLVLGEEGAETPLAGLTPGILGAFVVFFLLGFVLTALVYAAAGSLVSRQEDVQQVALPMLTLSFVAYFAAFFASGAPAAGWIAPLSWLPVFSPYLMLVRLVTGTVPPWELALAVGLLGAAILVALLAAARIYAAGVLLYGQRPTLAGVIRAARRT
ncbi:MAG TPA: ABC transporter permease [Patescibacteria group bacterium]|nr:ABC transporter permease [Patescibacteria group bacterium]